MKKVIILLVALVGMTGAMAQWVPQNSGTTNDLKSVFFTDVNSGCVVGTNGTILTTIDGGENWTVQDAVTSNDLLSVYFTDPTTGYTVGNDSIIYKTTDGGENWISFSSGISVNLKSVFFTSSDTGYVLGDYMIPNHHLNYILKTTDGGNQWTISYFEITGAGNYPELESIYFPDANIGYAGGSYGPDSNPYFLKTTNGGTDWTAQYLNLGIGGIVSSYFINPDTGYATPPMMKTTNGGINWTSVNLGLFVTAYSVFFTEANTGYVVGRKWSPWNSIILKTTNGGTSWATQYSGTIDGSSLLSVFFANNNTGYAVGNGGTILKTTNGGNNGGCPEGITFTTQEDIDNFQTNYPGCTEIEGDVIISGSDITNLIGLNILTSIEGTLSIGFDGWGNGMLTNLAGLENLTTIGGSLIIGGHNYGGWMPWNPLLSSLNGLDNLISIGGNLTIYYNPELSDLTGLYGITSIQGNLTINENYSLTNCSIQNICDYLNTPSGIVEIYKNGPGCNSQSEVVAGCGGSIPCLPYGSYYFISQADIDNFQANFPGCNELAGNLTINGNSITNLTGLNPVISIAGHAMIQACLNLTSLSGLNNLLTVGGSLQLMYNSSLINLTGFENLHSVGGLRLCENYQLSDLSGLENLDSIGGWLAIGTIFTGGPNPIPGGNDMLVSLNSLANLTYVGGGINIGQNNSLPSLAGLENINANTVTDLYIGLNNSLTTCDVQSICDYLISPNGTLTISNNAPGCNSEEEVEEHCLTKVEEIKIGNELTIIPNPSNDIISISSPEFKGIAQFSIFNVSGEKVLERQLTDTETQIDINALPRGVYFVRLQNDKMVEVGKLVKE